MIWGTRPLTDSRQGPMLASSFLVMRQRVIWSSDGGSQPAASTSEVADVAGSRPDAPPWANSTREGPGAAGAAGALVAGSRPDPGGGSSTLAGALAGRQAAGAPLGSRYPWL